MFVTLVLQDYAEQQKSQISFLSVLFRRIVISISLCVSFLRVKAFVGVLDSYIDSIWQEIEDTFLFVPKFSVSFYIVGQYVARSGMRKHKSWNVNFSLAGPAT